MLSGPSGSRKQPWSGSGRKWPDGDGVGRAVEVGRASETGLQPHQLKVVALVMF